MKPSRWGLACGLLAVLTACDDENAKPAVRPEAVVSPSVSASVASTVAPPEVPPPPPTLGRFPLELEGLEGAVGLHTIEGAVMISAGANVYRVLDEGGVEKAGTIPEKKTLYGDNQIRSVYGRWPDLLGAEFHSPFGRAPMPTYAPLKGGGGWYRLADGGGLGIIYGIAHHGDTTTLAGYDMYEGYRIIKVRGELVKPAFTTRTAAACPEEEHPSIIPGAKPAVRPAGYGSTRKGTVISVGSHCEGHAAAEVWRAIPGKGMIVSLEKWLDDELWSVDLLRGEGDTLYIDGSSKKPVVRYRDGDFAPLPPVPGGRELAFVSASGQLFATSAKSLFVLTDGGWKHRADLAFPADYSSMAVAGDRVLASYWGTLYELKPQKPSHLDPNADEVDCATPLIFLFDARPETPKGYRFPQTAEKMATFEHLDEVELVDWVEGGQRVGIKAKSWKAAKAAWAHVRATMPDEKPLMLCHAPPEPRVVKVTPKKAAAKVPSAETAVSAEPIAP